MDITWYRRGNKSTAVGVLMGSGNQPRIAGEIVWTKHAAYGAAFTKDAMVVAPAANTRGGANKQSRQERLGFHSFGRGDLVLYTAAQEGDPNVEIVIFGVIYKDSSGTEQGRKHIILYESESKTFFVGNWTQYARRCKPEHAQNSDNAERDDLVCTASESVQQQMMALFDESLEIQQLTSSMLKKRSEEPPPTVKAARKQSKQEEKERAKETEKKLKRQRTNKNTQPAQNKTISTVGQSERVTEGKCVHGPRTASLMEGSAPVKGLAVAVEKLSAPNRRQGAKDGAEALECALDLALKDLSAAEKRASEAEKSHAALQLRTQSLLTALEAGNKAGKYKSAHDLPPGWKQSVDAEGTTYFYNKSLSLAQYERPHSEDSPPLPPPRKDTSGNMNVDKPMWPSACINESSTLIPSNSFIYPSQQRMREMARLRGMLPYLQGIERACVAGELAALEVSML